MWKEAKELAQKGFSIIPLESNGKKPLFSWKEFQKRKPSMDELEEWFKNKDVNIGIICGGISGNLVVLDFDDNETFKKCIDLNYVLKRTKVVKTGRGWHVYFRTDEPVSLTPISKKVTIKGEASYVVAPPSIHESGKQYLWIGSEEIGELKEVESFIEHIRKQSTESKENWREVEGNPLKLGQRVPYCIKQILEHGAEKGERNERCFDLARYFYNKARTRNEIISEITKWNKLNKPILPILEIETTIDSVINKKYSFGCGRLKNTSLCHEVCSYHKGKVVDASNILEVIKEFLDRDVTYLKYPINFSPEKGIFYIIPIPHVHSKVHSLMPILGNSTVCTINVVDLKNQEEVPHSGMVLVNPNLLMEHGLNAKMLSLFSEASKNPNLALDWQRSTFEDIKNMVTRYIYFDPEILHYVVTCWIVGSYLFEMFSYYPFLVFRGEKGSGKGSILALLSKTCWNATDKIIIPSSATLYRIIENSKPTLIIDEYHRVIKNKEIGAIIMSVIEAGIEKGTCVPRCSEDDPNVIEKFNVFCPKVIATREELEHEDKAINIVMTKKFDLKYAKRRNELDTDNRLLDFRIEIIKFVLAKWKQVYEAYKEEEPTNRLTGRYFNLWSPILAICKIIFPDKYNEMLDYAEKDTESKISTAWENENLVLEALSSHLDDMIELDTTYRVLGREIGNWTDLRHWKPVKDALSNLKIINKETISREGKLYYLEKRKLKELIKERQSLGMLEVEED